MLRGDISDQVANRCLAARVRLDVRALDGVGADYGRAFGAEQFDRCLADPRCGAGDDCDLAFEPAQPPLLAN